jgi:hypothetical protein
MIAETLWCSQSTLTFHNKLWCSFMANYYFKCIVYIYLHKHTYANVYATEISTSLCPVSSPQIFNHLVFCHHRQFLFHSGSFLEAFAVTGPQCYASSKKEPSQRPLQRLWQELVCWGTEVWWHPLNIIETIMLD